MASDISCLVAAIEPSVLLLFHFGDIVCVLNVAYALGQITAVGVGIERTCAGAAVAKAYGIFESFSDGHFVLCIEE